MNKNTIIGLVLIFALIVGFSWWNAPSKEEREKALAEYNAQLEEQHKEDSIATVANSEEINTENAIVEKKVDNVNTKVNNVNDVNNVNFDVNNPFSNIYQGNLQSIEIKTEVSTIKLQNLGGNIAELSLNDYKNWTKDVQIKLFDESLQDFYLQFYSNKRQIKTNELYFEVYSPSKDSVIEVKGDEKVKIAFRAYPNNNSDKSQYIEFAYTFSGNSYMFDFDVNFVGMSNVIETNTDFIDLQWNTELRRNEKAPTLEDPNSLIYYKPLNDKVDELGAGKDKEEKLTTPIQWIAFKQQFFSSVLIMDSVPMNNADLHSWTDKSRDKATYVKSMEALIGLPYQSNADNSVNMHIYAGPNKYKTLRSYHIDLERMIPLGWGFFLMQWVNRVAVIPVFDWLERTGMNYGLIILILTILIKVVLSPITFKSYMSSAKMRVIKPEVDEISAKYPKQEQAMDKQKAVMALYKKAGINQLAGCIPMLIQMPILIAVFRFFPAAIELRQVSFLWADDLSSYDSILNLPWNIPFYGDHVSLFALMMAVTNLLYTMTTMKQQSGTTQMPGMKVMMYIMPIMFLGFLNSYSAALNYYYTISTLMTFLITWIIRISINEDKVRQKIAEHKVKPVKKSNFMKRMEEIQRQQSQQAKKRK